MDTGEHSFDGPGESEDVLNDDDMLVEVGDEPEDPVGTNLEGGLREGFGGFLDDRSLQLGSETHGGKKLQSFVNSSYQTGTQAGTGASSLAGSIGLQTKLEMSSLPSLLSYYTSMWVSGLK